MQKVRAQIGASLPAVAAAVRAGNKGWNGMVARTPHGLRFDLVKSALQKYIRRGELSKAEWCAIEIDSMGVIEDADYLKAVKSSRTNVLNRLAASLGEDCLDPSCIVRVVDKFRALLDRTPEHRNTEAGMTTFVRIVRELAAARKGRMASMVKMYARRKSMPQQWQDTWDAQTAPPPGKSFKALLEEGDMRAASTIPAKPPRIWRDMFGTKGCMEQPLARRAIACLQQLYEKMPHFGEKDLFIWQAVYLCLAANRGYEFEAAATNATNATNANDNANGSGASANIGDVVDVYKAHLSDVGRTDAEEVQRQRIADYCIDKHTKQGRTMGKTVVDFAIEGSKVTHPNQDLLPRAPEMATLEQMYLDSKTMAVPAPHEGGSSSGSGKKRGAVPSASASASASSVGVGAPAKKKRKQVPDDDNNNNPLGAACVNLQSVPLVQPDDAALAAASQLQPRTCGKKPMTWSIGNGNGKRVVIKPIPSAAQLQTVLHPLVVDACKPAFGLAATNVTPIMMYLASKKADEGDRYALERTSDMRLWIQMDLVEGAERGAPAAMVTDRRRVVFGDAALFQQYCKVACFRWLLRVTDFNPRNVLLGPNDTLYSIDEARIGSRSSVFGRVAKEQPAAMKRFPEALAAAAADILGDLDAKLAKVARALEDIKSAYAPSLDPAGIIAYMRTNAGLLKAQLEKEIEIEANGDDETKK